MSTSPVLNNKVLLWYRYVRMLATCYYTRSPYCCCVATIVHTGDQLPDPRLVSRALISREARVSHFAPRETTLPPRASDCPIPTNGRPILPNSPGSRSHPNTLPVRRCAMQHDDKPIGRQPMALKLNIRIVCITLHAHRPVAYGSPSCAHSSDRVEWYAPFDSEVWWG